MRKDCLGLILICLLLLVGCFPGDPLPETAYTQDVLPGTNHTSSIGSASYIYEHGYFDHIHISGADPLRLTGDAKVYFELRPDLDFETVRAQGKPTQVARGVIHGFSLPIYSNDNEELFLSMHTPDRWDNVSNILVHIHCYLTSANDGKNFNLQVSWMHYTDGDVVPDGSYNLTVETATGTAVQYQSFHIDYTLDYDIVPADPIASSDELHLRLRRLDASTNEIAGEVVITHVGLVFLRDKLGNPTP